MDFSSHFSLDSNKIAVFPYGTSDRSKHQGFSSNILNEHNITNLVKSLTDKDSYVISYYTNNNQVFMEFILGGYFFRADITGYHTTSLFAGINVGSDLYLSGTDNDNTKKFDAIKFDTQDLELTYTLQLLDSNGNVPKESLIKFHPDSMAQYDVIYCGSSTELV